MGTEIRRDQELLSAMAVVVAAADEKKDFWEFFMPFVADRLKRWPKGQPVVPHELSQALCDAWGFPTFPAAVSRVLLQRAQSDKLVRNLGGRFFPDYERLLTVRDLSEKRHEMLAGLNALNGAMIEYARDVHSLDWDEVEAGKALERLTEEFGGELATARHGDGLGEGPSPDGNELLVVGYGFARHAMERDPANFDRLVSMVQGAMIANVLYFEDLRKLPNRLPELRVYIDTAPLLRGLGLARPEVAMAAREMLTLMRSFRIPMFVFAHTIDEITAILERTAEALQSGTREARGQGKAGGRSREAVDAAIQSGMSSGEVLSLVASLEQRLEALGVRRCETPRRSEAERIDEEELAAVLAEGVPYPHEMSLERDLQSLVAVDCLRGKTRARELASTRALFITANDKLALASRRFFRKVKRDAPIPHCMTDIALTAQLWVGSPARKPDLPRRLLIADCYSALAPSPAVWERWVTHIIKLQLREELTEAELLTLIYSRQIQALLVEVTRDDPENVDDDAVTEVLARYKARVREAAEREAREAAERERQELLRLIESLRRENRERAAEIERAARRRARRARLVRRIVGFLALLPIVGGFSTCVAMGEIQGRAWWATSVTLLVFACACAVCWALEQGWKAPVAVLITAGALSSLWVNVFGVVGTTTPKRPTPRIGSSSGTLYVRSQSADSAKGVRSIGRPVAGSAGPTAGSRR